MYKYLLHVYSIQTKALQDSVTVSWQAQNQDPETGAAEWNSARSHLCFSHLDKLKYPQIKKKACICADEPNYSKQRDGLKPNASKGSLSARIIVAAKKRNRRTGNSLYLWDTLRVACWPQEGRTPPLNYHDQDTKNRLCASHWRVKRAWLSWPLVRWIAFFPSWHSSQFEVAEGKSCSCRIIQSCSKV